jgi:PAS domain S-box-containing protein
MTTSVEQSSEKPENKPNPASGKKPASAMQGLTVRQKIYLGFGGLMLLTALNVGYSILKLNDVEKIGISAFQQRQPAANLFQRIVQDINYSTTLLNSYLLTGQKDQREDFEIVAGSVKERISVAHILDVVKTGEVKKETLVRAAELFNQFLMHADHLFHLRDNNLNNRGLILAQDTINSAAIQFLNNTNILVASEDLDSSDPKAIRAKSMLEELRYVWVSMMSNMRLFITTQGDSHLANFRNFNERAGVLLDELSRMDIEIGFGELDEMVEHRDTYNAKLPAVIEIFRSDNWREDSFMMKTEMQPLLEELLQIFEGTADILLEEATENGYELTEAQDQLHSSALISLVIIIWIGTLLGLKISGHIVPPIRELMTAAKQISDGDLNAEVMVTTKDEIGMLGLSFNTMVNDLRTAKLKELNLVDELSTINEELESRVEERTEELGRSESKIRAVLDNIGEGILVLDDNSQIQTMNPAAEKIFNTSEKETIGMNATQLIQPKKMGDQSNAKQKDPRSEFFTSNSDQQPKEYVGHRPDGSTFPMEYVVSSMKVGDETMHVCIMRDITTRKETEATLAEAQQTLVDGAHKSGMADMATGVLHNIGNILNSVNLAGEQINRISSNSKIKGFIRANELLEEHKENLADFFTTDDRGKKLPAYYLKMGKVLTGEMSDIQVETQELIDKTTMMKEVISTQQAYAHAGFHTEQLEIHELMEDALKIQIASLEKWGVKLHKHYRETPACIGQKSKLLQVITNLLKNAKEAMNNNDEFNKPKELTIETGILDDNFAYIKVADNGCGISSKQLAKIFNHGFTTKEQGHGFGLHTSANAMTEMRGTLKVDSAGVEKGASFTLTIPIYKKAA